MHIENEKYQIFLIYNYVFKIYIFKFLTHFYASSSEEHLSSKFLEGYWIIKICSD